MHEQGVLTLSFSPVSWKASKSSTVVVVAAAAFVAKQTLCLFGMGFLLSRITLLYLLFRNLSSTDPDLSNEDVRGSSIDRLTP